MSWPSGGFSGARVSGGREGMFCWEAAAQQRAPAVRTARRGCAFRLTTSEAHLAMLRGWDGWKGPRACWWAGTQWVRWFFWLSGAVWGLATSSGSHLQLWHWLHYSHIWLRLNRQNIRQLFLIGCTYSNKKKVLITTRRRSLCSLLLVQFRKLFKSELKQKYPN